MLRRLVKMAAENAAKRLKTGGDSTSTITIGTHNGHFHADEALAVYMLRQLPEYAGAALVRTRDPAALERCHTVVDVGGQYDAARHRYDHHQRTFDTKFPGRDATRLSSAGLIWLHFGRSIIARRLAELNREWNKNNNNTDNESQGDDAKEKEEDAPDVSILFNKFYQSFVEPVDANDNGVAVYDPELLAAAGAEPRYRPAGYTLGAMVGRLNPAWNDPVPTEPAAAQAYEDARFERASARIGEEFSRALDYLAGAWLPARAIVAKAYAARHRWDPSGRVMVFEGQSVPWKDHLYDLEEEEEKKEGQGQVLYVLYPENPQPDAKWRVQAVPITSDSFQSRKPLPAPWRAVRDAKLDEVAALAHPGGVFVHAGGFIGGHNTFDGAREMATKACDFVEPAAASSSS